MTETNLPYCHKWVAKLNVQLYNCSFITPLHMLYRYVPNVAKEEYMTSV